MAFDEVQFPTDISFGSKGGPGYKTDIIMGDGGAEQRVSRWSTPRWTFDASYGVKSAAQARTLLDFYLARLGAARGFRYKDFTDFTSAADGVGTPTSADVATGVGDSTTGSDGTATFQLIKKYTSGLQVITRNITKPVSGTDVVQVNGAAQTRGVDYNIDTTTGIITFTATNVPTTGQVIRAGFEFDVPVRFSEAMDEKLAISIDNYANRSAGAIGLVEVRDGIQTQDDFLYGGAAEQTLSEDKAITTATSRVFVFGPTTSGLAIQLPDPTSLAPGGPYFYIFNASGSNTLALEEHDTTGLATIGTSSMVTVILSQAADGTKVWYCF